MEHNRTMHGQFFGLVSFNDLKQGYPVEVVEYAKISDIADELRFACLSEKGQDHCQSEIKWYWCWTHKYDVQVLKSVTEAVEINNKKECGSYIYLLGT